MQMVLTSRVLGCDREEVFEETKSRCKFDQFKVVQSGFEVARASDYIIYSVEAENVRKIVSVYGPATKVGAIVGGQTSCKCPEIEAFEEFVADDVDIITLHSMHGPKVDPVGQPLVLINHRVSNPENAKFVLELISVFESKIVELTAREHDKITADTQAVTHAAFLSMGKAWANIYTYPWTTSRWTGGIENAKANIAMRIYLNKWHVYAGLAITNKYAHDQILQYSRSTTEIFTLMIQGKTEELRERMLSAKEFVFEEILAKADTHELLLDDHLLLQFSLSNVPPDLDPRNSHLSLLAIVDSWFQLRIIPYRHIICSTPLFRIFLGVTEYLFIHGDLLESAIEAAISDTRFRADDLEFTLATRTWSSIVSHEDYGLYKKEFEQTQDFFKMKFLDANRVGNEMIKTILQKVHEKEKQIS